MSSHPAHSRRSSPASRITSAIAGGAAGFIAGLALAQVFGGVQGILGRLRDAAVDDDAAPDEALPDHAPDPALAFEDDWDDSDDDADADADADDELGERVLAAFQNDPTLVARPIDIDVGPDGTVELSGHVDAEREVSYAATVAGGVPGVRRVVTRLGVNEHAWRPTPA
ncbi:MAG TPA: BON domain-containing protein [Gemmatimonadaceae bacterium]|nr:BON domain-containing protein [Gemmatimonadaceae bacterium]